MSDYPSQGPFPLPQQGKDRSREETLMKRLEPGQLVSERIEQLEAENARLAAALKLAQKTTLSAETAESIHAALKENP
jgi:cell shape-determining protein MreC